MISVRSARTLIAFWILLALTLIALALAIIASINYFNGQAGVDNANTAFDSLLHAIEAQLQIVRSYCCPPIDGTIPTCMGV